MKFISLCFSLILIPITIYNRLIKHTLITSKINCCDFSWRTSKGETIVFQSVLFPQLIKQIIRILFVLNPSPQLFIIGFYVVVFLHHEEVIGLYPASYIRELFRMLANGADRKFNSHVDIIPGRITRNAKFGVDFLI